MDDAEKLLRNWRQSPPKNGARCEDALKVMTFLGMDVESNNEGHHQAFHKALLNNPRFQYGSFTVNCHAKGTQGKAHSKAILDILKAARIIQDAQQKDENDRESHRTPH